MHAGLGLYERWPGVTVEGRADFTFEEISFEGNDRLELEYGIRIPVVTIDGREAFEIEVDPEEFATLVRA